METLLKLKQQKQEQQIEQETANLNIADRESSSAFGPPG
jgi:hypothetical protein